MTTTTNGPGQSHREGISLIDLFEMFPDDATAEAWFVAQRWPNGIACPHCGSLAVSTTTNHPTMPYHCPDCRKFFSVKSGTVMHSSKVGYRKWALAIYILTTGIKGTSSMKLHRDIGVTQKTAWHMAHRIRESWAKKSHTFAGPVEVDETYVGGKEKNKHASQRLNAGRGTVGKTVVVGVKDRETNKVSTEVVRSTDKATLQGVVTDHTTPGPPSTLTNTPATRASPTTSQSSMAGASLSWATFTPRALRATGACSSGASLGPTTISAPSTPNATPLSSLAATTTGPWTPATR